MWGRTTFAQAGTHPRLWGRTTGRVTPLLPPFAVPQTTVRGTSKLNRLFDPAHCGILQPNLHSEVHKVDHSSIEPTPVYAPVLSLSEMALRDRFVVEYLVDYDGLKAAIRIGYSYSFAKQFSTQFLNEPYVLNKIKQGEVSPEIEFDEGDQRKKIVVALWREANNLGAGSSQSARVAALSKLSAFYGMDAPVKSVRELTGKDGAPIGAGVFVVPGLVTAEEWAKQAELQQSDLIKPDKVFGELKAA